MYRNHCRSHMSQHQTEPTRKQHLGPSETPAFSGASLCTERGRCGSNLLYGLQGFRVLLFSLTDLSQTAAPDVCLHVLLEQLYTHKHTHTVEQMVRCAKQAYIHRHRQRTKHTQTDTETQTERQTHTRTMNNMVSDHVQ